MTPFAFPQANFLFLPPADMMESQVASVDAYVGDVRGGSVDGARIVVTAWRPTAEEVERIFREGVIYLTFLGEGLPPHYLSVDFEAAIRPG